MLAILNANEASATFFVQGNHVGGNMALLHQELAAHMEIGNHTWSHPDLTQLSDEAVLGEVNRTDEVLSASMGPEDLSGLFRAPYGLITSGQAQAVTRMGYTLVHWSLAVDHYVNGLGLTPAEAAEAIAAEIRPGDILLAHDGPFEDNAERHAALTAIEELLPILRGEGFTVATVSTLLASGDPVQASPRPWFWQSGFECPSHPKL